MGLCPWLGCDNGIVSFTVSREVIVRDVAQTERILRNPSSRGVNCLRVAFAPTQALRIKTLRPAGYRFAPNDCAF